MPVISSDRLIALQTHSDEIRNICILAHVDHGKTSLTDALLATNGIISAKMAGKIRYLDSRPDEQLRGITMESSAISLYFSMARKLESLDQSETKEYLINLIDSPGHVDFSSEVSTASRLCDGALVLVDAVEGVCSQTITVLRHTWTEHLKPLLVINKIDRLITELKMSPAEAYSHLSKLLEQVNAVMGSFFQGERMEEDLKWRERMDERIQERNQERLNQTTSTENDHDPETFEEKDDEDIYFAPEKNNVVFSSAIDGWAFTVKQFAALYEKKLNMNKTTMGKVLWGDFYLDPKTKRVLNAKHLKGRPLKPTFVQLVLEPIWSVYEATVMNEKGKGDQERIEKITKSLNIAIPLHVSRSKDSGAILTTIMTSWLPLSVAMLVSVIEYLPSPSVSQADRLSRILDSSPGSTYIDPKLRNAMVKFGAQKPQPVVAYVSKMVAVKADDLPESKLRASKTSSKGPRRSAQDQNTVNGRDQKSLTNGHSSLDTITDKLKSTEIKAEGFSDADSGDEEDKEHLIGFARIFSGTLAVGDEVYVMSPKFNPGHPYTTPRPRRTKVTGLYLLMGRGLESLSSVPAGVVFGIAGIGDSILKSGTLCSQLEGGVNLAGVNIGSQPIVRVALEPTNPGDLKKMISGCKMLEQSDPCAEYSVLENGEHVISTAGELHLERCLKDLRERFAKCEIQSSEPIVPYRESIVSAEEMNALKNQSLPRGTVFITTVSKQISIRLRVRPLPAIATEYLIKHSAAIRRFYSERKLEDSGRQPDETPLSDRTDRNGDRLEANEDDGLTLEQFRSDLQLAIDVQERDGRVWTNVVDKIAALGPRRIGPNVLIDSTEAGIFSKFLHETQPSSGQNDSVSRDPSGNLTAKDFSDNISHAFQLVTAQGPLCNEPIQGVAVFIEEVKLIAPSEEDDLKRDQQGRLTGEVLKTVRDAIKQGFLEWSPRILLAMYSCEIQASAEVLGKVYAVITRRRGRILSEAMKEGTPFFSIQSVLPVAESFGFSEEIRKRTSGAASPQLLFHGYEMLDEDPFWVPSTEEDLEDLGELADKENVAKRYMDGVRLRKGLMVQGKKLVKDAEKQKTLKR